MIRLVLVGWQLVEITDSHIAAEIELAVFALCDGETTPRIKLAKNGRISSYARGSNVLSSLFGRFWLEDPVVASAR